MQLATVLNVAHQSTGAFFHWCLLRNIPVRQAGLLSVYAAAYDVRQPSSFTDATGKHMSQTMKIDFISDVSCPWCAIGLHSLETALGRTRDVVDATIDFHPYELNPTMPPQGQNIVEHVAQKYGSTRSQSEANRDILRARAAEVGFTMLVSEHSRIYNTRDAHRLLHWAAGKGRQSEFKHRLFDANFTENLNVSDPVVLTDAAERAGLDRAEAQAVLASDRYGEEVRDAERMWRSRGIHSVPAILIDGKHLISGGQTPAIFEQAIREIAAQA